LEGRPLVRGITGISSTYRAACTPVSPTSLCPAQAHCMPRPSHSHHPDSRVTGRVFPPARAFHEYGVIHYGAQRNCFLCCLSVHTSCLSGIDGYQDRESGLGCGLESKFVVVGYTYIYYPLFVKGIIRKSGYTLNVTSRCQNNAPDTMQGRIGILILDSNPLHLNYVLV